MLREVRLAIMQQLIYWAVCVCPKDSHETMMWFGAMPFDKGKKRKKTNGDLVGGAK